MLFGADVYWSLVSGEICRGDDSGLVAINSKLGWLLNGPVHVRNATNTLFVEAATMKVEVYTNESKELGEEIHKFWDLDTIGIKEGEHNVLDYVMDNIEFENGRYQVELPFKSGILNLPDNFKLSLKRLETL